MGRKKLASYKNGIVRSQEGMIFDLKRMLDEPLICPDLSNILGLYIVLVRMVGSEYYMTAYSDSTVKETPADFRK